MKLPLTGKQQELLDKFQVAVKFSPNKSVLVFASKIKDDPATSMVDVDPKKPLPTIKIRKGIYLVSAKRKAGFGEVAS